jgi:ABC-type uncharacterized transport system involved in gliding motility auxiliary subunit
VQRGERKKILESPGEESITNGIISVTRQRKRIVGFVVGHGENDINDYSTRGYSDVKRVLEEEDWEVKEVLLASEREVSLDYTLLIVSGPRKDYLKDEAEVLDNFIQAGGKILFMIDPHPFPNLSQLLAKYNIILGEETVVDKSRGLSAGGFLMPLANDYGDHPVTNNFNLATIFPLVRPVEMKFDTKSNLIIKTLVKTSSESWAESYQKSIDSGNFNFQP